MKKREEKLKLESLEKQAQPLKAYKDRRMFQRRRITNVLQEAERLVYEIRNKDYKHPTQNFSNIANLWNAYLLASGRDHACGISPIDIAAFNILQKIARISCNQTHIDSWLDIAGYAACADRIINNK